jgi:hypothetical protein
VHVRRVVVAVAVVGLAASGCSSEPQSGELDLEGDEVAAAPATPDPPAEVTEEPSATSEPPDPPEDDQLYPPLPPLEPDPNSDVSVDVQREILALHAEVYHLTQSALHTSEFDPDELGEYLNGDLLDDTLTSFESRKAQGHVSRSPDTRIEYVRVVDAENGPVWVHECSIVGPETATYDAATGERLGDANRDDPVAVLLEIKYSLVETAPGVIGYRAETIESIDPGGRCRV